MNAMQKSNRTKRDRRKPMKKKGNTINKTEQRLKAE